MTGDEVADYARRYTDAARIADAAAVARDRVVVEARAAGATQRQLAAALGVSHTMVAKIERRAAAAEEIQ